jgi:hypothetical protein
MKKFLLVLSLVMCLGCMANQSKIMHHPDTGQIVRVAHYGGGTGLLGLVALGLADKAQRDAIKDLEKLGFKQID